MQGLSPDRWRSTFLTGKVSAPDSEIRIQFLGGDSRNHRENSEIATQNVV